MEYTHLDRSPVWAPDGASIAFASYPTSLSGPLGSFEGWLTIQAVATGESRDIAGEGTMPFAVDRLLLGAFHVPYIAASAAVDGRHIDPVLDVSHWNLLLLPCPQKPQDFGRYENEDTDAQRRRYIYRHDESEALGRALCCPIDILSHGADQYNSNQHPAGEGHVHWFSSLDS